MACLLQRLAVRLTYLTALFTYQRTLERRNLPYTINTNRKVHFGKNRFAFFLSHHIGTTTCDLMTKSRNFFIFLLPHHICPASSCLLSWKRKKSRFLLSIPYLSADRPNNDCLRKFLENIFQSKIPLFLRNSGISL